MSQAQYQNDMSAYDVNRIRADFPIISQEVHGKPLTFLDNGANRLVQTATTVLVIGGTFLYISPLVAIFAFVPIPIIIFGSLRFTSRIAERYTKIRNDIEKYKVRPQEHVNYHKKYTGYKGVVWTPLDLPKLDLDLIDYGKFGKQWLKEEL